MNDRQKQIAGVATDLFLTEGVGVSTAQIAKMAGVSNGTLFNAFPTKQALIDAIYLDAKTEMFAAIPNSGEAAFTRASFHENWRGYLDWAQGNHAKCRIMHFLLDSGLASQATKDEVAQMGAVHGLWLQRGLESGRIKGPSVAFVGSLVFFFADQVINDNLGSSDTELVFDMLCQAIGLTK